MQRGYYNLQSSYMNDNSIIYHEESANKYQEEFDDLERLDVIHI